MTPSMSALDPLMTRASAGQLSGALLAHLNETFNQCLDLVDKRVYKALTEGPLDPDFAVQAWIEKAAYCRLRNQLLLQNRVGHNAATRAELILEGARHAAQA